MSKILKWFYCFLIFSAMYFAAWFFHSPLLWATAMGFMVVILGSVLCFYAFYRFVRVKLQVSALKIKKGESVKLILRLANYTPYPFLCERGSLIINNLFYKPESISLSTPVPAIFGKSIAAELSCEHCGLIRAELDCIVLSDMLGLVSKKIEAESRMSVSVMPIAEETELPSRVASGAEMSAAAGAVRSNEGEPSGVREYTYGDRLNSINWKLSARADKLMTKDFEKTIGDEYIFLLDTCRRFLENSLTLLYSVCVAALENGESFYVIWQSMGSEQLSQGYVTNMEELDETIEQIYLAQPQSSDMVALNTYRSLNAQANVIYIGEEIKLI